MSTVYLVVECEYESQVRVVPVAVFASMAEADKMVEKEKDENDGEYNHRVVEMKVYATLEEEEKSMCG